MIRASLHTWSQQWLNMEGLGIHGLSPLSRRIVFRW
jgi:hypothetical protein